MQSMDYRRVASVAAFRHELLNNYKSRTQFFPFCQWPVAQHQRWSGQALSGGHVRRNNSVGDQARVVCGACSSSSSQHLQRHTQPQHRVESEDVGRRSVEPPRLPQRPLAGDALTVTHSCAVLNASPALARYSCRSLLACQWAAASHPPQSG